MKNPHQQQPPHHDDVDDCLETPSEDGILSNLSSRYARNQVFSALGSNAMLAVNPKRTLESFSDACSKQYLADSSQALSAHVFQLAESAYNRMASEEQDQSIILM